MPEPRDGARQSADPPATVAVILALAAPPPAQLDAAVLAADSAFAEWGQTTPKARTECLLKLADSIEQNALEFARLESQNCGKPLHCVINDEIPAIVDVLRFFAGAARC
ncbi:gamma-aminobutyraldehyde dehydrogenase, partial [Salmonella enterica subsp. enterica serovar Poona]